MAEGSLADQAYEAIKNKISLMENDSHLSVRATAAELDIGYTPVREALLRLEREGYVKQVPKVGFLVRKMTGLDIKYYYQARECIEPFVLSRAFSLLDESTIKKMEMYCTEQEEALKQKNYSAFIYADTAFHEIPFLLYKNPHLLKMYRALREKYRLCSELSWDVNQYPDILQEHRELLKYIRLNDREKSVELLTKHICASMRRLWEANGEIL